LPIGGLHNVENAIAAAAAAQSIGIDPDSIRTALSCFKGVKRRFETVYRNSEKIWIDDYAHHPEELRALLQSVRDLYPNHYMRLVFQPHLFTRTRDLADAFGEALSLADESLLLPIYPARELPIEGVRSEMIRSKQYPTGFSVHSKESFMDWMVQQCEPQEDGPTVIVTAGAGDIDQLYPMILNRLKHP